MSKFKTPTEKETEIVNDPIIIKDRVIFKRLFFAFLLVLSLFTLWQNWKLSQTVAKYDGYFGLISGVLSVKDSSNNTAVVPLQSFYEQIVNLTNKVSDLEAKTNATTTTQMPK